MAFVAKRCGVQFNPPAIVLVYQVQETDKMRRRVIPVRNFSTCSDCGRAAERLKHSARHRAYLEGVSPAQLQRLHLLLQQHLQGRSLQHSLAHLDQDLDQEPDQDQEPEPDQDPDLNLDTEHLQRHSLQQCLAILDQDLDQEPDSDQDPDQDHDPEQDQDPDLEPEQDPDLEPETEPDQDLDPDEDLNKLGDAELGRRKARMDRLFERNRRRRDDPGFIYDLQVEFEEEGGACSWDEESDDGF